MLACYIDKIWICGVLYINMFSMILVKEQDNFISVSAIYKGCQMVSTCRFMCGSIKFSQRWSYFDYVFFYNGKEDPNTTISGRSSTRQRNAI